MAHPRLSTGMITIVQTTITFWTVIASATFLQFLCNWCSPPASQIIPSSHTAKVIILKMSDFLSSCLKYFHQVFIPFRIKPQHLNMTGRPWGHLGLLPLPQCSLLLGLLQTHSLTLFLKHILLDLSASLKPRKQLWILVWPSVKCGC